MFVITNECECEQKKNKGAKQKKDSATYFTQHIKHTVCNPKRCEDSFEGKAHVC